jgi:3-phytase
MKKALLPTMMAATALGGCASIPIQGDPAVAVVARAETVPVGTANEDAADDPAIWRNAAEPEKSLIVATDKKAGLHVYNLEGRQLSFLDQSGLNNVDLVELPDGRVLVAASDRGNLDTAHILLAYLDTATGTLSRASRLAVGPGEGYGICFGRPSADGSVSIYSAPKNGVIYRTMLSFEGERIVDRSQAVASVASQPEGCVVDDRTRKLYIGEEVVGIWAFDVDSADMDADKRLVARIDNRMLVADVEGLAIYPQGEDGGMLVASSQGDNTYAVYELPEMTPVGRFRIAAGTFGSAEETDGIELASGSFGSLYPGGLFVAQDGANQPEAQNFKLVSWAEIMAALSAD